MRTAAIAVCREPAPPGAARLGSLNRSPAKARPDHRLPPGPIRMNKARGLGLRTGALFFALLLGMNLLLPKLVQAHRVNVFAWLEGAVVHTQSTGGRGKPIVDADIKVYADSGELLLQGTTDTQGEFSFPRPDPGPLKIQVHAGPGHQAVWTLGAQAPGAGGTAPQSGGSPQAPAEQPPAPAPGPGVTGLTAAQITKIVDAVVARRVTPLQEMLATTYSRGPGIKEIMGGLGYILGLMGVAAYVHYRRKPAELGNRARPAQDGGEI